MKNPSRSAENPAGHFSSNVQAPIERLRKNEEEVDEAPVGEADAVLDGAGTHHRLCAAQPGLIGNEAEQRWIVETQLGILNALPAHLALLDERGVIVFVNDAWKTFAAQNGLSPEKCGVGDNYIQVCERASCSGLPDVAVAGEVVAGLHAVLRGHAAGVELEYPCHSPTQERWFRVSIAPIKAGERTGAVVMHINITERKQAEDMLAESEEKFRQITENIQEVFWMTDVSKREIIYLSPAYEKIWGQSCEAAMARPESWCEAIYPDDRERVLRAAVSLQATGEYSEEYRIVRQDGSIRWIHDRAFPVRNEAGEVYRIAGVALDITERILSEERLRESEAMMSEAQRIAHFGSWELAFTNAEAEDGKTLRWSDEIFRIFGYEPGEVQVTSAFFFRAVPAEDHALIKAAVATAIGERKPYSVVHRILRPNGEQRYVREIAQVYYDERTGAPVKMVGTAHDITEQQVAEEALRASEERFQLAFRGSAAGLWDWNLTQKKVYFGPAYKAMLGYGKDEVPDLVDEAWAMIHPDDLPEIQARIEAHFRHRVPYACEFRHKTKAGEYRWFRSLGEAVWDEEGRPRRMVGSTHDITERKLAEEKLRESEARLRNAQRLARMGNWEHVPETGAVSWSDMVFEILGVNRERFTGHADEFWRLIHPEDLERVRHSYQHSLSTGVVEIEHRIVRPDGELRHVCTRIQTQVGANGTVERQTGTVQDITERKRAEQRITEQAALLDKAQDAIVVKDLEGRIAFWNRSAERLYGWSAAEAVGRQARELLATDKTKYDEAKRALLQNGDWNGEMQKLAKDRRTLIVETRWTLVRDEANRPKSILAIDTDVTEKRKLEAQFLRAQRLESLGTLAGGIAHDLNNVLAPVRISLSMLRDDLPAQERREILDTLDATVTRGADMVKQVLQFARGVEGERVLLDPGRMVRDVVKIAGETFPKNIKIEFDIAPECTPVIGDGTQIHQVLLNLCVNSRDAMPEGGRLVVRAAPICIDENYASIHAEAGVGDYIVFTVTDSGSGIPPEIIGRIFDPFFTTKEVGKGTGLGLATVATIVRSHGGFVNVYSESGRGTTMKVFLPTSAAHQLPGETTRPAQLPRGRGEGILLVDDEQAVRIVTCKTLERAGYRVFSASNGEEALDVYAKKKDAIDIIVTDMMMPVMDGPATVSALKKLNPQLKIIGASGLAPDFEKGGSHFVAGVDRLLAKPYTAESLLKALRSVLTASP